MKRVPFFSGVLSASALLWILPQSPAQNAVLTPGLTLNYDAHLDFNANNRWENTIPYANPDSYDFEFANRTNWNAATSTYVAVNASPSEVLDSQIHGITRAYSFPLVQNALAVFGVNGQRTLESLGAFGQISSGDYTQRNGSYELWIRPENFDQQSIILDVGGSGNGTSLVLAGNQLRLTVRNGGNANNRVVLTHEFQPEDLDQFHQIAFTIQVSPNAGGNQVKLHLNGQEVASAAAPGVISDWAGANLNVLGGFTSRPQNNFADPDYNANTIEESFQGEISVIRFYGNQALTEEQINQNYLAVKAENVYFDNTSGNTKWKTAENWSTDLNPTGGQNVIIHGGHTVDLSEGFVGLANNLTVGSQSTADNPLSGTGTLNLSGSTTKLLVSNDFILGSGSQNHIGIVNHSQGQVVIGGDLVFAATGTENSVYTLSNGGSLIIEGNVRTNGILASGVHYHFNTAPKTEYPKGQYLADFLTDQAEAFIRKNQDRPFYLSLHHYGVHSPYQAKKEWIQHFKKKQPTEGHHDPVYAAMIASVDESVGRILSLLEELKLEEKTLVIFTSDNGGVGGYQKEGIYPKKDLTSNAPLRGGKGMFYEGGIRVPYLFFWKGKIKPGTVLETPIHSVDLFPTLVEVASAQTEDNNPRDGLSYLPALLTQQETPATQALTARDLFWHFPGYLGATATTWRTTPVSVIRSGDWKLLEFLETSTLELYHLSEDPGESKNLAQEKPEIAEALHQKLKAWREQVKAPFPTPNTPPKN